MIRAAIIPGGWSGFVLADENRPLLVESFQVGTIAGNQRIITDQDVAAAVTRLIGQCASAEEVVINWSAQKDGRYHDLQAAIFEAFRSRGTPVRYLSRWRRFYRQDRHRAWLTDRLSAFTHWPESGRFQVCRDAGAMLLEAVAPSKERRPLPPEAGGPLDLVAPDPSYDSITVERATDDAGSGLPLPGEQPQTEPASPPLFGAAPHVFVPGEMSNRNFPPLLASAFPASPPTLTETQADLFRATDEPAGPPIDIDPAVVAGIDPGSGHVGLCIARGSSWPLAPILVRTYRASTRVPLARPRKSKRQDGTEYTVTTRESLTPERVAEVTAGIVAQLRAHGVSRLAIEHVDLVHMPGDITNAAKDSLAQGLVRSMWIAAEISVAARAAGIEVDMVTVHMARGAVAGRRAKGEIGTEHLVRAIGKGFQNWPASDGHARDAGILAMWLTRPAEPAPVAKARARKGTKDPRLPGQKSPGYYAAKEREKATRAALRSEAGCTCANHRRGRHSVGCPLAHTGDWRRHEWLDAARLLTVAKRSGSDALNIARLRNARDVAAVAMKREAERKAAAKAARKAG